MFTLFKTSPELLYLVLLFALFVVPRFLQRYRLPSAVSSVAIGILLGAGFDLFKNDPVIGLLSTLGIVSLFLFAGLDVDLDELRVGQNILIRHVIVGVVARFALAIVLVGWWEISFRAALVVALALLTPSTGFILDALPSMGLSSQEQFWVKGKAIASEIVALAILFFTMQSTSVIRLSFSATVMTAMVLVLPFLFRLFARQVVPYAPKSEFAFLLMLALVCSFVTRKLGAYYLIGAFIVGLAAKRFEKELPTLTSQKLIHALEVFASFFISVYFLGAGLRLRPGDFGSESLATGGLFLLTMVPLRVLLVGYHLRITGQASLEKGARIGLSILPTLVFGLVLAEILRVNFNLPQSLFGGIVIYALVTTLIPGFLLKTITIEEDPTGVPIFTTAESNKEVK